MPVDELTKLWSVLSAHLRKAADHGAEGAKELWAAIVRYASIVSEHVQALSADQLRPTAALLFAALLLALLLWMRALSRLYRTKKIPAEAQARCETLQAQYDNEVKWRTASERVVGVQARSIAPSQQDHSKHPT